MVKLKNKKVRCDVCNQVIQTKKFNVVLVSKADYEDRYEQESLSDFEKEIDVCNNCILNLNFREVKPNSSHH